MELLKGLLKNRAVQGLLAVGLMGGLALALGTSSEELKKSYCNCECPITPAPAATATEK